MGLGPKKARPRCRDVTKKISFLLVCLTRCSDPHFTSSKELLVGTLL